MSSSIELKIQDCRLFINAYATQNNLTHKDIVSIMNDIYSKDFNPFLYGITTLRISNHLNTIIGEYFMYNTRDIRLNKDILKSFIKALNKKDSLSNYKSFKGYTMYLVTYLLLKYHFVQYKSFRQFRMYDTYPLPLDFKFRIND